MKKQSIILILLLVWMCHPARAQQQWNLPLIANWDDDSIPQNSLGAFSECWGYVAPDDREYAFLGSTQGTYFFDISDPSHPAVIDFIRTKDTTTLVINKDYATYLNYLYAVSDQGDNSLQIFDLQYLPDSVVKVYDSNAISKRCHTIFVDHDRLYLSSNTRPNGSFAAMDIVSLANPLNPVLLGSLSNPGFYSVHEAYIKNDTAYCSNGYDGLWIYSMKFPATPILISMMDFYPQSGYCHSVWLTSNQKTMVMTDENHGLGVKIFDMSDINEPQIKSIFRSNMLQVVDSLSNQGSIAHNPYIIGNILFVSYYHDGVRAYDISDPSAPLLIGYYDTFPQNTNYNGYNGCWGLYPFLPSGNIIASDISNGLFILDGSKILKYVPEVPLQPSIVFGTNAVVDELEFYYTNNSNTAVDVTIIDLTGRLVYENHFEMEEGAGVKQIPVKALSSGIYVASLRSLAGNAVTKFVKIAGK